MPNRYKTVRFRLGAEVDLSDEEIESLISGKTYPLQLALEEGRVKIGNGIDSYIPQIWLDDIGIKVKDDVSLVVLDTFVTKEKEGQ